MDGDTDDDANYDIGHTDTDTDTDTDGQLNGCPRYNCNVVIDGDDGDDDDENTAAVAADDVDDADDADIDVNATVAADADAAVAYYDAAQVCVQHQPLQPLLAERSGSSSGWFFPLSRI